MLVRFHVPVVIAMVGFICATASGRDKPRELRELRANRAKWQQQHITSYEVRLRDDRCACWHALGYGPVRVIVNRGKVQQAIYEGETRDGYWAGRTIGKSHWQRAHLIATIEGVFEKAEAAIKSRDEPHKIAYDPEYGFPTVIDVDNGPGIADGQWRLIVDRFRPNG
jgi:Family of unknown function (DUF6174)